MTVPIIVGRLTRDRSGLKKSNHGGSAGVPDDVLVHTEFGADVWGTLGLAGFDPVSLFTAEYPCAIAIAAFRPF